MNETFDNNEEKYGTTEIKINRTTLIREDEPHICGDCGTPTYWFDINMGQHLCSELCVSRVWQHYMETLS